MEKLLYIMLIWVVSTTSIYSQTVAGKIVDESNQPIEFANIVCLSLPDSTFIYGTISDQDGKFTIPENSSKGILRISSVGYATTYKECKDRNIGTILLHSDTQLLGEVVVKGNLPVTRMKARNNRDHFIGVGDAAPLLGIHIDIRQTMYWEKCPVY